MEGLCAKRFADMFNGMLQSLLDIKSIDGQPNYLVSKKIGGHVRLGAAATAETGLRYLHVAQCHRQAHTVYVATSFRRLDVEAHR